jgi:hypothetical protein
VLGIIGAAGWTNDACEPGGWPGGCCPDRRAAIDTEACISRAIAAAAVAVQYFWHSSILGTTQGAVDLIQHLHNNTFFAK